MVSAVKTAPARSACLKVFELSSYRRDPRIKDIPRNGARLFQYFGGLLRISTRLITEAAAISVNLNAALHDDCPTDQDVVRRRHRAMTLIGAKVSELRTELAPPHDGVTAIARMAEIYCVCHVGYVTVNQIGIPAEPTAGEDQRFASDPFSCAVRMRDLHSDNASFRIRHESLGNASGSKQRYHSIRRRCAGGRSVRDRYGLASHASAAMSVQDN